MRLLSGLIFGVVSENFEGSGESDSFPLKTHSISIQEILNFEWNYKCPYVVCSKITVNNNSTRDLLVSNRINDIFPAMKRRNLIITRG